MGDILGITENNAKVKLYRLLAKKKFDNEQKIKKAMKEKKINVNRPPLTGEEIAVSRISAPCKNVMKVHNASVTSNGEVQDWQ
jgi:hypothetical protein